MASRRPCRPSSTAERQLVTTSCGSPSKPRASERGRGLLCPAGLTSASMDWQEKDGVRWLQARLPGATAAFSTRSGGVSEGDFATLNVGLLTEDEPEHVGANRRRLAAALGRDPEGVLFGH